MPPVPLLITPFMSPVPRGASALNMLFHQRQHTDASTGCPRAPGARGDSGLPHAMLVCVPACSNALGGVVAFAAPGAFPPMHIGRPRRCALARQTGIILVGCGRRRD